MPGERPPHTMEPEEIVDEIGEIRASMTQSAQRLYELARGLYVIQRRSSPNTMTASYINYSNSWMRFSGAVTQGLKRTVTADRLLSREKTTQDEEKREADRRTARKEERARREQQIQAKADARREGVFGDLIELYGEEMVRDASR